MKSLITVSLLGLSCILVNQASAESFNDRSPEWSAVISSSNATPAGSANRPTLAGAGFNNRSEDWLAAVVPGQGPGECQSAGYVARAYGFNNKSVAPSDTAPTAVSGTIAASSSTRQDYLC